MSVRKNVSRNFAIVASGNHKGAKSNQGKNMPDSEGFLSFTSNLSFLWNQKEKRATSEKPNSFLLGTINTDTGFDSVKKRLNFYGLFGKKSQNEPKKFEYEDLDTIFIYGNVTPYQVARLELMMVALIKSLGDDKVNRKTIKKSPKYQEALEKGKQSQIIVQMKFDEAYFEVSEDDESKATLSGAYVSFGTGKKPLISNISPGHQTFELEFRGETIKGEPADECVFTISRTRNFLYNFGFDPTDKRYKNYKNMREHFPGDGKKMTFVSLGQFKPEELDRNFFQNFEEEAIKKLEEFDKIQFSYTFPDRDTKTIQEILNFQKIGDAVLVFTGKFSTDLEKGGVKELDDDTKIFTFYLKSGTFYTQKRL